MPFVVAEFDPGEISFFHHDRAFRRYDPPQTHTTSVHPGLGGSSSLRILDGRLPPNRVPDRGSISTSGNSGGTAGELAPDPTRGHVPSVHDVLAGRIDQERGVKQATRGRPSDEQQLIVRGQHDVV